MPQIISSSGFSPFPPSFITNVLILLIIDLLQKRTKLHSSSGDFGAVVTTKCFASNPDQLKSAREDIKELLKTTYCHPIMVNFKTLPDCIYFDLIFTTFSCLTKHSKYRINQDPLLNTNINVVSSSEFKVHFTSLNFVEVDSISIKFGNKIFI